MKENVKINSVDFDNKSKCTINLINTDTRNFNKSDNFNYNYSLGYENLSTDKKNKYKYDEVAYSQDGLDVKLSKLEEEVNFWRNLYINNVKTSLNYEEIIKTMYEENRLQQEYIINLEKRLNDTLDKTNSITNNFHNNIKSLHKMIKSIDCDDKSNNFLEINLNLINDFKSQLEIISDEKENMNSNISLLRHQNLQQMSIIEDFQKRVVNNHKEILSLTNFKNKNFNEEEDNKQI